MRMPEDDRAIFTRVPELGSLELMRASYHHHRFVPHSHPTFALGVIEEGAAVTEHRGTRYTVPAGSVMSINPGEIHTGGPLTPAVGWRYRMLYPEAGLLRRIASERIGRPAPEVILPAPAISDPELARAIRGLHAALEGSSSALKRETLLYQTFGLLIERHAQLRAGPLRIGPEHAAVARVKEYLSARIRHGVSLTELAALVALNPFHLIRLFRKATGLPPYAYFEQLRIERAVELLRSGVSISDVVFATGFSDQSHLTRRFRRVVGVSPGRFARSRGASGTP